MDPSAERAIAERSSSQLGLFTHRQARDAGLSSKAIRHRVAAGNLVRVGEEVLRPGGLVLSWERQVMAACLDVHGVASHRTAAWLHRLDGIRRPESIEVTVAKGRRSAVTSLARVHTSTNLPEEDVIHVDAIPTTSIARTFLDLAKLVLSGEVARETLVTSVESAIRDRRASDRWLWWLLEERRRRGRNGVSALEAVLSDRLRLGPTESWLERETLRVLVEGGLPLPRVQRRITRRGAFVSRVDFAYDDVPVIIEVEGKTHLLSEQHGVDARQRNELQLMGMTTLTFTYDHIVRDPGWVVATVRDARAWRGAA